jgi:hypothetical protein
VEISAGRYSALKTASCSQTSISSVSCTLDSASVHTRQSLESGYDSDSLDSDDLDEEDNAYFELPEGIKVGESDDEYEADAIDGTTARGDDTYGKYVSSLLWKFEAVEANSNPFENSKPVFVGDTKLKPGVSSTFDSPFQCFQKCGGCDHEFVALLAQHSNDYMKRVLLPNYPKRNPDGLVWKDITTAEMYRFLRILLKISISPIDGGEYPAYFQDKDMEVQYSRAHNVVDTQLPTPKALHMST